MGTLHKGCNVYIFKLISGDSPSSEISEYRLYTYTIRGAFNIARSDKQGNAKA